MKRDQRVKSLAKNDNFISHSSAAHPLNFLFFIHILVSPVMSHATVQVSLIVPPHNLEPFLSYYLLLKL